MATIRELWIPSQHHSSGRGAYLKGAFHSTEGAQKIRDLGAWFQNPAAGCSSHHGSDNFERGLFGAYVYENQSAWTQGNMNGVCLSLEQCTPSGAAGSWSRDTWLSKTILIDNAAEWMRYMAEKYKLPYTWLSGSAATDSWSKGFVEHVNFGSYGSGHVDCGNGFPNDVVMNKAKALGSGGGTTPTPASGGVNMPSCVIINNVLHEVGVWLDGRPHYQCEDADVPWYQIDLSEPAFKVKGDVSITANYNTGLLVVSGTGLDGNLYTWQQKPDLEVSSAALKGKWGRYKRYAHDSLR